MRSHTSELAKAMPPGLSAVAMGGAGVASTGDTNTDTVPPSFESSAVPLNMMARRNTRAYSKSSVDRGESTPLHWICSQWFSSSTGE